MVTRGCVARVLIVGFLLGRPADAATVRGSVSDATGGLLSGARVILRVLATGQESSVETNDEGRFEFEGAAPGTYLIIVRRDGFSEAARTLAIDAADATLDLPVQLEVGGLSVEVSVTATRAERETRQIPLHVESIPRAAIEQANTLSTGDALTVAANVTPVGNGPFGVRPRLRGLDSTRLLVLVDGERLNTARQATDRTGAEVGLIAPDTVTAMEIVNGAGTLLYGSDALAGTINIITNEPSFSTDTRWLYGFNGFYSTNEHGARGTATIGATGPRYAVRLQAGAESFDNYTAGALTVEDTRPFLASGALRRTDTIDSNFGFSLAAFPDPFNAPYVRTSNEIESSGAHGRFLNLATLFSVGQRRSVRVRYQRRTMDDVGFPDFVQPYFFNATSLPRSDLDRVSARYEAQAVTSWLANLSLTAHYQRTQRVLQNLLPVQFPAPTPVAFFPISVFRLGILSETEQRVWTPGVDLQAVIVPAAESRADERPDVLSRSQQRQSHDHDDDVDDRAGGAGAARSIGERVSLTGAAGSAVRGTSGPRSGCEPPRHRCVCAGRVDASPRAVGGGRAARRFLQRHDRGHAGLRRHVGCRRRPARDRSNHAPGPQRRHLREDRVTGDIGLVANTDRRVSPFVRFGRSYRHPNLEEMLYAGPATAGSIAPNVKVAPETGNNFDAGAKFNLSRMSGGAYLFVNQYKNFVAQDLAVAATPAGPLAQATNYADVRIGGLEVSADSPIVLAQGVLTLRASGAFTRGTITRGVNPLDGSSLDGAPADNITPVKALASARLTAHNGRWWVEYGVRTQTKVNRVTPTLLSSPFAIAQDLLSLDGFTVQRLGWGVNFAGRRERLGLTFAVENLANTYYREHFQFAPSRGRTFSVGVSAGAF